MNLRAAGRRLSAVSLLMVLAFSCKFNPDYQQPGSKDLQGVWYQQTVPYEDRLLVSTRYRFTFTCDSFFAVMQTTSKANHQPGNCFNGGKWSEYARGTYVQRDDSLIVNATFTHENFRQKITGCYRIGRYLPVFVIKKTAPDTLSLQNILEQVPIVLTLKQKITCVPKPL